MHHTRRKEKDINRRSILFPSDFLQLVNVTVDLVIIPFLTTNCVHRLDHQYTRKAAIFLFYCEIDRLSPLAWVGSRIESLRHGTRHPSDLLGLWVTGKSCSYFRFWDLELELVHFDAGSFAQ